MECNPNIVLVLFVCTILFAVGRNGIHDGNLAGDILTAIRSDIYIYIYIEKRF